MLHCLTISMTRIVLLDPTAMVITQAKARANGMVVRKKSIRVDGTKSAEKKGEKKQQNQQAGSEDEYASHEPQVDPSVLGNDEDEEDSPNRSGPGGRKSNSVLQKDSNAQSTATRMICDTFRIENLVRVFSGIVANCGEDGNMYGPIGNQSMDSTIQTFD
mmetsp:Transcript_23065/g.29103  ORF Transcript_23065/g.29103 Transcript_23065/m.29103 type:complete len:160 (+) Transcript_23065:194-673(+)